MMTIETRTRKKYRIRSGNIADNFIKFWVGGTIGLAIGCVIAIGMNTIHPIF